MKKFPPKQQRFVEEYLVDFNATRAAMRAGYKAKNADVVGAQLLRKTLVAAAIEKGRAKLAAKSEVSAERVLAELSKLGFANMQDYMRGGADGDPFLDFSKLTRDQAAALQEVTVEDYVDGRGDDARQVKRVKFKLADKRAALVDLGKHLGMFVDRHEVKQVIETPEQVRERLCTTLPQRAALAPETKHGDHK